MNQQNRIVTALLVAMILVALFTVALIWNRVKEPRIPKPPPTTTAAAGATPALCA